MFSRLLLGACVVAGTFLMTTPALSASTAKAALPQVTEAAKKWQADAIVTNISTLASKADGTASAWLYMVYSAKAKKSAIVTARDAKLELEEVLRNTSMDPLGDFIDSDKAMEAARKHGLKAGDSAALGLTMVGQATKQPAVVWSVVVTRAGGFTSWGLNSKDGSLVSKNETNLK